MPSGPVVHSAERWHCMPLVQQMANVGSEVERTMRAHALGNSERSDRALARALELFDLTATDSRWRGGRRREVLRARELFCALFYTGQGSAGDDEYLRDYFLQFAVAARRP